MTQMDRINTDKILHIIIDQRHLCSIVFDDSSYVLF